MVLPAFGGAGTRQLGRYCGPALPPGGLSRPHALGAGSLAGTFKLVAVGMLETSLVAWPLAF